eukprot:3940292-Rhodomonas_salina.3
MSGTDVVYLAMKVLCDVRYWPSVSDYAFAMRCPVLTCGYGAIRGADRGTTRKQSSGTTPTVCPTILPHVPTILPYATIVTSHSMSLH